MLPTRRQFFRVSTAAAAAGAGLGVYTWQLEPHWLEFVRRSLPVEGLPRGLDGATLVHLSDLHAGVRVADGYLIETLRRVAQLQPDIVAYTGDFVSYHAEVFAQIDRVFREAPRGRIATVGILGNHDYGPGWAHPEIAARVAQQLSAFGVRILRNESVDVHGLRIVGMDDLWARQFDPHRALAGVGPETAALVLSHNPDTVDLSGWNPFRGWVLGGHTHGGQCKPPFLPPPLLPVKNRRYTSGAFSLEGGRSLYISRGIGHLTQVRFNVRPEVTVFELRSA